MAPPGFARIAAIMLERSGVVLSEAKSYLLDSRLSSVARANGFASVGDFLQRIDIQGTSDALANEIVEAMLNNESYFFRDRAPFEMLEAKILPRLRVSRAASRRLRIWSAAASTGQEAYSIAMLFDEHAAEWQGWTIEIMASDLSQQALARARSGRYSQFEVQRGLSIHRLMRHFDKRGEYWELKPAIRSRVQFQRINLCEVWPLSCQFDVIFCRNVLMYLGVDAKRSILARLRQRLAADGRLILGAAETVIGLSDEFAPDWDNRGLYVPAAPGTKALAS
jgi:chemotaxis protein methyltransferase CheR